MKTKKLLLLLFLSFIVILFQPSVLTDASTTVIKKADGTDLTYRNSSEKVLRLNNYHYPTSDFRGVWISSFVGDVAGYTSVDQYKTEVDNILDTMELYGLNAMIFHIRIHNDALYDSALNPLRPFWSGVNFKTWDPLTYIIEESHKRGIEFHAWLNPYRILSSGYPGSLDEYATSFRSNHPSFPNNPAGDASKLLKSGASSDGIILNPGEPVVRQHIYDTIQEIIFKYDVDAIHFDDYFYNSVADTADNATYTKPGYNPKNLTKANWRREQVNILMAGIDTLLDNHFTSTGKVVQLGISPTGIYQNAPAGTNGQEHYSALYCDSVAWIKNEWIDYLLPQTYWGLEHTTAGFAQLTRYWNNVVNGYNVNMYMGHGIYMAPNSGWVNNDEIKNRLLNMGMYNRIDGSAFYKYGTFSSLNSANIIVRQGFNLLKDDYWVKKVPGTVVRSYANKVPITKVSNLTVQTLNNQKTIRWNKVDNVRGYMVYQVPKSTSLNQNNINHLYQYIQTNEITVNSSTIYDYYISTVNLANVVSSPVLVEEVASGFQAVINGINLLPSKVTLNDENTVKNLRLAFDQLNAADQGKVTNIQVLIKAESDINELKGLKVIVDDVINRTSKHITSDYHFPTSSLASISWAYKTIPTNPVHNLVTGKRLKEKLTTTLEILVVSATKDGYTYQEEVTINFGVLAQNQNGLFYRNSASALSVDEEGPYGSTSHIGWENKTLTIGNQVLFIAKGNYVSITDGSLGSIQWHSCGTVYHNQTSSDIVFLVSDSAIRTDVSNYGYIIIGVNKQIRVTPMDATPSSYVTLKAGEILFATHFLDSQITGSPFVPATNVLIGTTAYLTDYEGKEVTIEDQANQIIQAINSLTPASQMNINTLSLPYLIVRANYDNLSSEAKALVTNLQKLIDCEVKLEQLKGEAFIIARDNALGLLTEYENNLSKYSSANQVKITGIINNTRPLLQQAKTLEEVNNVINQAQMLLNAILTIQEEAEYHLINLRNNAIEEIENYFNLEDYSSINKVKVQNIKINAIQIISVATLDQIEAIVIEAKTLLDNILTLAQEAEILLNNAKKHAKNILNNYVNIDNYSPANQLLIINAIKNGEILIDSSKTANEVQTELNNAKYAILLVKTLQQEDAEQLEIAKNNAKEEISSYPNLDDYTTENKQVVNEIINSGNIAIEECLTTSDVINVVNNVKSQIDKVEKTINIDSLKESKKAELTNYVNLKKYSKANQTKIKSIIESGKNAIDGAQTLEDVNQAYSEAKGLIDEIEQQPASTTPNCSNMGTYLLSMIAILSLSLLILRKND